MIQRAIRYHDFSAGHRVVGHEGKCRHLHGHNYRVTFHCEAKELDALGRVIDFGVIKERLCEWLETEWDHKFLAWQEDDVVKAMERMNINTVLESIVWLPFNPTAENMASHLLQTVCPEQLRGSNVVVVKVEVSETRKCSAVAIRESHGHL